MNTLTIKTSSYLQQFRLSHKRLILPILMLVLIATPSTHDIAIGSLSDAFWAVSCYVALTLSIYHYCAKLFSQNNKLSQLYHQSATNQVVIASLLGALPGCGGAIVVTSQFISGRVGFGSLVAVLTATMGDAAFLLLASQPATGLGVVLLGIVVGIITGLVVNKIHPADYLRPTSPQQTDSFNSCSCQASNTPPQSLKAINLQGQFWQLLLIPTAVIALLGSFQVDSNQLLGLPEMSIEYIGVGLLIISMFLWALTSDIYDYQSAVAEDDKSRASHPIQKAAQDTHFISAWVIVAFLAFELTSHFANLQFDSMFSQMGIWMPLIGLAVGMLPGCGPQILITSLYLTGAVPLSAQISNAIANDGDALFPAIALAPKAAMVASIYTAVPAFITGYAWLFLFE
ncbi:putative manganese transporter [Shewanella marina]|uniref:putative manganese transporter n=1 Tax=Shewanella marina TaxID=487319 RepID=UPI00047231D0|nr:putative manganese transporter [Shewanella marina]